MRLIILTPPDSYPKERRHLVRMMAQTSAIIHLRKPAYTDAQLSRYLDQIPPSCHARIMVHDHWTLLDRFDLRGIHLTENARRAEPAKLLRLRTEKPTCRVSSAFHQLTDLRDCKGYLDYCLLSPLFESISKQDYPAAFDLQEVRRCLARTDRCVIALGGIDEQRIPEAAALGFCGVAALGSVWGARAPVVAARRLAAACRRFVA